MNTYRSEGYVPKYDRVKLDMYLTYAPSGAPRGIPEERAHDCARQLRAFADEFNFQLNIKVAAPYIENEEDLCYLMTSQFCSVEAFTMEDYKNLAKHLDTHGDARPTRAAKTRDEETQRKLKEIRYSKYDYKTNYSILN